MKLKNQFRLFILGTITVPLLCAITIPMYHYFTDPERILLQDFTNAKRIQSYPLSDDAWNALRETISHAPPHVETAVIINRETILISSIAELKNGEKFNEEKFFQDFHQTGKKYFYQFVSPPLENDDTDLLVISRVPRRDTPKSKFNNKMMTNILLILLISEAFTIFFIVKISTTISRSISILEKNTQRIANGELSVKLSAPSEGKGSNEITSLTENLEKMRLSLKDDQERRTRFIMGISHDLRTPVAVIKGYTEAISDGTADDPEMIKNALNIIGTKTNQLETMIDTLINYVKLNNSVWREQLASQPLEPVLQEFAQNAVLTGKVFKRKLSCSIRISKDVSIPFNKQLLIRALENIYSNALRYSRDGDSVSISAEEDSENVKVAIADTGIGIAESEREHIFDLFYKASNSRREEGMGIGLSVVKNIIDTHGWLIAVSENPGGGSIFTITIPKTNSKIKSQAQ